MGRVADHFREQTVGHVALVAAFVVGGGVAYAGGLVTSKDIKNDTIRSVDLNIPLGSVGSSLGKDVPLTNKFQTVLSTGSVVDDGGALGMAQAVAEVQNTSAKDAAVDLRLIHVGHPKQTRTFTVYVPAGATTSGTVQVLCNGIRAGKNAFVLEAAAAHGVTVTDATLFGNYAPPGGGN